MYRSVGQMSLSSPQIMCYNPQFPHSLVRTSILLLCTLFPIAQCSVISNKQLLISRKRSSFDPIKQLTTALRGLVADLPTYTKAEGGEVVHTDK